MCLDGSGALRLMNFGLGIYLAGLAGVLAAGMLGLLPTLGGSLIMPSFVAIIVGGLGSLPGTLIGGLLIGVASGLVTVFLPSGDHALTIVLIEHDMPLVFRLAEIITVLNQGRVLASGPPAEIARNDAVQAAYLGKQES